MTAPVDPRPYAAPTDLVTAEDVARWLREQIDEYDIHAIMPPREVLVVTTIALLERLDRERRQACRRGALAEWHYACGQRAIERDWRKSEPDEFQSREDIDEWAALAREDRIECVRRALAFRAAARAR